ncbi:hypothetical protein ACNOYE_17880 [Nannocystaceae bacterium ST9]
MPNLLLRAIITGFGLRLGSEIAKLVANRLLPKDEPPKDDEEGDELGTISAEPPAV